MDLYVVENWWRHNGAWDRAQASGIPYCGQDNYFVTTDYWWWGLSDKEKKQVYEEFFNEN